MRNFTLTELSRGSGAVVDAAFAEPVVLTKHGKGKLVMLPFEQYEKLVRQSSDKRISRYVGETPDEERLALTSALAAAIAGAEPDNAG